MTDETLATQRSILAGKAVAGSDVSRFRRKLLLEWEIRPFETVVVWSLLCATEFQLLNFALKVKLLELIKFRHSTLVSFFFFDSETSRIKTLKEVEEGCCVLYAVTLCFVFKFG